MHTKYIVVYVHIQTEDLNPVNKMPNFRLVLWILGCNF